MNESPLISVIVPVYKVESYLPKCLDSILAQTFEDFELLLIDDGSPDRCGEICDECAGRDERVRVFHQENAGLSCARNTGLRHARGTYIAFVDSDDYITADYLESLCEILPANKECIGVVVGGFDKLLPDGSLERIHVPERDLSPEMYGCFLTELMGKHVMYACMKLYDNRLIRKWKLQFVPSISGLEDMLFMLDYLAYADFVSICDCSGYVYRVGYSMDTLSRCIKDFPREYGAFSQFLSRVCLFKEKYRLEDRSLSKTWDSLTVFFHKVLLAIYKEENAYTQEERLLFLRRLLFSDGSWIREYFFPQYKADRLGKFLLVHVGAGAFDAWMSLLTGIRFKYMFGARK